MTITFIVGDETIVISLLRIDHIVILLMARNSIRSLLIGSVKSFAQIGLHTLA